MVEKNKSKITLEKLALMVQKGFLELENKITSKIKEEINGLRKEMYENFMTKEEMYENFMTKEELSEKFMEKEEIRNHFDFIYGAIQDLRDENAFGAGIDTRQQKQIDNHEQRIFNIEQKIKV